LGPILRMMKKLLLFWFVLGFYSAVMAAGHVELRIAPEDVNTSGYSNSETITIQLYATGFYTDYPNDINDTIGFMDIASITTDNGGTASAPVLHPKLEDPTSSAGTIVNSGGVLIEDIHGNKGLDLYGITPFPAVLWECEFHIPDAPLSSIITIGMSGLVLKNIGYQTIEPAYTVSGPLEIQMACCSGDTNNDGCYNLADYNRMKADIAYANYLLTGGSTTDPNYNIWPSDPCVGFLWNVCCDVTGDGVYNLGDYNKIKGDISYANYLLTGGSTTDPNYNIWPGNATVGFLWPCN